MKDKKDRIVTKKEMIIQGAVCAASFLFYGIDLESAWLYVIPVLIAGVVVITAVTFVRYKKMHGIEILKPICISLFAIWLLLPRSFMPVINMLSSMMQECVSIWYSLGFGFAIAGMSIVYLVRTRNRKTAKYPAVLCLVIALFLTFLWNVEAGGQI